jgi:uncharacterized protein YeaO (DUF488 family)
MIVFGNVIAWYLNGIGQLKPSDLGVNGLYLVEVCNSNKTGIKTDMKWFEVVPSWKYLVEPYLKGHMTEQEYTERYIKDLESKYEFILMGWEEIKRNANGRFIVLLCHEKTGQFCHRHVLVDWMFEKGMINVILNNGRVLCHECYYNNGYDEMAEYVDDYSIEATATYKCNECEGGEYKAERMPTLFDDDGIFEFGKDY